MIPYPSKSGEKPPRTTYLKLKIQKCNFEKNGSKLFVKLYFKWPPSLNYSSQRWIFAESKLFVCGIQNFGCFSTKIQRKFKIKVFDPNLHSRFFSKFCFRRSAPLFLNLRSYFKNRFTVFPKSGLSILLKEY